MPVEYKSTMLSKSKYPKTSRLELKTILDLRLQCLQDIKINLFLNNLNVFEDPKKLLFRIKISRVSLSRQYSHTYQEDI